MTQERFWSLAGRFESYYAEKLRVNYAFQDQRPKHIKAFSDSIGLSRYGTCKFKLGVIFYLFEVDEGGIFFVDITSSPIPSNLLLKNSFDVTSSENIVFNAPTHFHMDD